MIIIKDIGVVCWDKRYLPYDWHCPTYEDAYRMFHGDVSQIKGKTWVKNGILYDKGVAVDYSDSERDYDY